jgi:hypothetical protein
MSGFREGVEPAASESWKAESEQKIEAKSELGNLIRTFNRSFSLSGGRYGAFDVYVAIFEHDEL